jgi:hypothetical protein
MKLILARADHRNVQVTVQILKALIEKIPRDLPLYARYVLRILDIILRSGDLTVTEETLSLFKTFCEHHDVATLAADQEHIGQYEEIVRIYANFAALDVSPGRTEGVSTPVAIRWRSAGLQALQSVTSSEAVGADGGRQLNIIMPIILRNLHPEVEDYITVLAQRAKYTESADEEMARRRMSIATVRTSEVDRESYTGTVPGQPDDADRLAEEEVALQALKDLKQIFTASNRAQIRMGTSSALKFICTTFPLQSRTASEAPGSGLFSSWPTALLEMIAGWAPVQDRFVILVTVVETMIRNPMTEENLVQQLLLINLVECLLRSSVNMIGLSVMDVLVGLIQHILLLLQLGGKGSNILPHHQQTDAIDLFTDDALLPSPPSLVQSGKKGGRGAEVASASTNRQELLARLQRCIGDLATHIYYSDQISDIISAILLRLKPSLMSAVASDTAAVENPGEAAQAISSSANLQENRNTDGFFSFGTARVTALKAIKEVLIVANLNHHGGSAAVGRNRVSVQVWEGTQWLLRDHDRRVRRAYVDALLTWLRLEMTHNDLRVIDDKGNVSKISSKPNGDSNGWGHFTKRAVSLASQREKNVKPTKSTFLRLLHLAIYDNAIESPESDTEILLLHLLMVTLVEKLGVNAVKTGLPMVLKLQEDINDDEIAPTPSAKVKIGSLVHGYFWVLIEKFDLNSTGIGDEIDEEIARRKLHGLWLEAIQLPPVPLDQIMSEPTVPLTQKPPLPILLAESLKPFDSCSSLVDQISLSYASSMASPPSSPPASPARVFSMPLFSSAKPTPPARHELPSAIKDEMLSPWSKEICIATLERESPRAVSLSGSRNGTLLSVRQKYLGIKGNTTRNPSPTGQHGSIHGPTLSPNNNGVTSNAGLAFSVQETQDAQFKRSSAYNSGSPTPLSSSDHNPPLRIDELKRVLAGTASSNKSRGASPLRNFINRRDFVDASNRNSISSGSESAVTANSLGSESERGLQPLAASSAPNHLASVHQSRAYTDQVMLSKPHGANRPLSQHGTDASRPPTRGTIRPSSSSSAEDPAANAKALRGDLVNPVPGTLGGLIDDDVPPVPPLPPGVSLQKNVVVGMGIGTSGPEGTGLGERGVNPRQGSKKRGVDVSALLGSIDVVAQDGGLSLGGGGKPPY